MTATTMVFLIYTVVFSDGLRMSEKFPLRGITLEECRANGARLTDQAIKDAPRIGDPNATVVTKTWRCTVELKI